MKRKDIFKKIISSHNPLKYVIPTSVPDVDNTASNNIERIIFAPDPVTGLPMSDLSLPLDVANDPSVRQYVDKWLHKDMSSKVERSNVMDVDDFNPEDIKSRKVDRNEYVNGLRLRVEQAAEFRRKLQEQKDEMP